MTIASVTDHTKAVIDHLVAGDLLVGDGVAPPGSGWDGDTFRVFVIVEDAGGGGVSGLIDGDLFDARMVYGLKCVGASREQADWARDEVRQRMLDQSITVAGRRVNRVTLDVPIATRRDDDTAPPLFYSADRYRLWTTPAPPPPD